MLKLKITHVFFLMVALTLQLATMTKMHFVTTELAHTQVVTMKQLATSNQAPAAITGRAFILSIALVHVAALSSKMTVKTASILKTANR